MSASTLRRRLPAAALLLAPATAQAHLVNTGLGPVYDGVSHFALTPEDLVPALALALLAGQGGPRAGRLALFALPAAWLLGGLAGLALGGPSEAPLLTTVSFLGLGGLVAAEARLRAEWVAALAAVVGLLHGGLNGTAMAQAHLGVLGRAGIVATLFDLPRSVARQISCRPSNTARAAAAPPFTAKLIRCP